MGCSHSVRNNNKSRSPTDRMIVEIIRYEKFDYHEDNDILVPEFSKLEPVMLAKIRETERCSTIHSDFYPPPTKLTLETYDKSGGDTSRQEF